MLVDRLASLGRVEVMATAVAIQARWQPLLGEGLQTGPKARGSPFLLNQESRVDRAGCVVHGNDQVEFGLAGKPGEAAAVLVQHHSLAWLPWPLASMCSAALSPLDQTGGV